MPRQVSINTLIARRQAKLDLLAKAGPSLQGSLGKTAVRCGNPACKCAAGEKHIRYLLTRKLGGKSSSVHIPVDMVEEATAWTKEYRRIKRLLKEVSDLSEKIIRLQVPTRRARAVNQAAARRPSPPSP